MKITPLRFIIGPWFAAFLFAGLAMLTGCAAFTTVQTDARTVDPVTKIQTSTVTTRASARAIMAGQNTLKGWKASQTEKTQGASIAESSQASDANQLMQSIGNGVVQGFIAGMAGRVPAAAPAIPSGFKLVPIEVTPSPQP